MSKSKMKSRTYLFILVSYLYIVDYFLNIKFKFTKSPIFLSIKSVTFTNSFMRDLLHC